MKFTANRPYADADKAARKIIEIAKAIEPVQNGHLTRRSSLGRPLPRSTVLTPSATPRHGAATYLVRAKADSTRKSIQRPSLRIGLASRHRHNLHPLG
jgi:hypothetical protein